MQFGRVMFPNSRSIGTQVQNRNITNLSGTFLVFSKGDFNKSVSRGFRVAGGIEIEKEV